MWICSVCSSSNNDRGDICVVCGSARESRCDDDADSSETESDGKDTAALFELARSRVSGIVSEDAAKESPGDREKLERARTRVSSIVAGGEGKEDKSEKSHGDEKLFIYYLQAAKKGDPNALRYVGECYFYGTGVDRDYEKAVHYLKKAAELEVASACYFLGLCYENGYGTRASAILAINWYLKGAAKGDERAAQAVRRLKGE